LKNQLKIKIDIKHLKKMLLVGEVFGVIVIIFIKIFQALN
jgi:hypothetical protein